MDLARPPDDERDGDFAPRAKGGGAASALEAGSRITDARIAEVIEYISHHLEGPLDTDTLAAVAGVGRSQLARLFGREMRQTAGATVRLMRMRRARELLVGDARLGVKEVAAQSGFRDVSHFVRDFGRLYGSSPAKYRRSVSAQRLLRARNAKIGQQMRPSANE